jgi:ubiquinone/menaquinone biosynthesis C-methylase UbiE
MDQSSNARTILDHYRQEAEKHGLDPSSTMADPITREKEVTAIRSVLASLRDSASALEDILELGCGNGFLLSEMRDWHPAASLTGIDFSPDMVELAQKRGIDRCVVAQGDVAALELADASFDVVVTERCIVNLLDPDLQDQAFHEIARVLRPGGHFVMVEAFSDGLENLNRAREELGLEPHAAPYHNRWLDKARFEQVVSTAFTIVPDEEMERQGLPPHNFLSSHYFISRVLYPAVTNKPVTYATEFVKFFQFLPTVGTYAGIQLFLLRKLP